MPLVADLLEIGALTVEDLEVVVDALRQLAVSPRSL